MRAVRYTIKTLRDGEVTLVGPDMGWDAGTPIVMVALSEPYDLPATYSFGPLDELDTA